ncbi:MAG TPA: 50S ribosomal protein L17 [bacterium]|jgi:large subunit ribosomal protein L17|nr:50S ribosomal protein L17 [bacterium]HQG58231.1 50S ribosomal protein L17 [bacterium]HQG78768.1 50S ribosomal protein L17 [bacterium]HQK41427.1 50S ribosomal protein L17 [bacterium]
MRHRVVKKKLNRDKDHREALISNLSAQIIEKEKVNTTLAKAKYIRPKVEKMITKAVKAHDSEDKIFKFNTVKELRKDIRSESAIKKLMNEIAPKFSGRKGGYTKIVKTGNREGDNALTARIEIVSNLEDTKEKLKRKNVKKNENKTK